MKFIEAMAFLVSPYKRRFLWYVLTDGYKDRQSFDFETKFTTWKERIAHIGFVFSFNLIQILSFIRYNVF